MTELERLVKGNTVAFGNFDDFIIHCQTDVNVLLAIQLPKPRFWDIGERFVAFLVKGIEEMDKERYRPVPAGRVYTARLYQGFIETLGDCSFPLKYYPVEITQMTFNDGKVFVLDQNSDLGIYIQTFMREGKIKALSGIPHSEQRYFLTPEKTDQVRQDAEKEGFANKLKSFLKYYCSRWDRNV